MNRLTALALLLILSACSTVPVPSVDWRIERIPSVPIPLVEQRPVTPDQARWHSIHR